MGSAPWIRNCRLDDSSNLYVKGLFANFTWGSTGVYIMQNILVVGQGGWGGGGGGGWPLGGKIENEGLGWKKWKNCIKTD